MEKEHKPVCVLLISGKRKSGKDYFVDELIKKCDVSKAVIIKISAPIKTHFANKYNLNLSQLLSSGEYKESYRKSMITWSDGIRMKDPGFFCRAAVKMFNAESKLVWIVSDVRRKTDIIWFKEHFKCPVKTIRIEASSIVRMSRNWSFVTGIDDVESECDLDNYNEWDWILYNEGDVRNFEAFIKEICIFINSQLRLML